MEETQSKKAVYAEAEIGVVLPQTKECRGLPATIKS